MLTAIRTHYHERDPSFLIGGCLGPLNRELRARLASDQTFFRAHWRNGPHVDLVLAASQADFEADLLPLGRAFIAEWLRDHPSTTQLDAETYHQSCMQLAAWEEAPPPTIDLHPNNAVVAADYVTPPVWGSDALGELREEFMAAAAELVVALCGRRSDEWRFHADLVAMMALITHFSPGEGFTSYFAHGESFLARNGQYRPRFEQLAMRYAGAAEQGLALAESIRAGEACNDEVLSAWLGLLARVHAVASETLEADETISNAANAHLSKDYNVSKMSQQSGALMAFLTRSDTADMFRSNRFLAARYLINLFYIMLSLVGVSGIQRFCLCFIVANAWRTRSQADPFAKLSFGRGRAG